MHNGIQPLVSVILPVYNAEKYLCETLESIINQSYKNMEIVIVNDGSVDSCSSIVRSFIDSRIIYIEQDNKGLSKTLNTAIERSTGEYICRIDADDICHPDRIMLQIKEFLNDSELCLVGSNVEYIDEFGKTLGFSYSVLSDKLIKKKLQNDNCIFHPTTMFKKSSFKQTNGYDEDVNIFFEDYILWLNLAKFGKFKILPKFLLKYRIHKDSVSSHIPPQARTLMEKYARGHVLTREDVKSLTIDIDLSNKTEIKSKFKFFQKNSLICFIISKFRTVIEGVF